MPPKGNKNKKVQEKKQEEQKFIYVLKESEKPK